MNEPVHTPVLLAECLALLAPRDGGWYADATVGLGGHADAVLRASAPTGRLIGIDRDAAALARSTDRLAVHGDRVQLVHRPFGDLRAVLDELGVPALDGLLVDLGVSSLQLDDASRGFSFRAAGPVDMRMDPSTGTSATELVAALDEADLASLLRRLGEVDRARSVARAIRAYLDGAPAPDTAGLAEAIARVLPRRRPGDLHPATAAFMALRIAVNDELGQLARLLEDVAEVLAPGGVAAIIAFHSLEDRLVKRRFAALAGRGEADLPRGLPVTEAQRPPAACALLTPRAVKPGEAECAENPRARSARLRAVRRLGTARSA